MSNSLRDQLMQLGFQPPAKPEREPRGARPAHKGGAQSGAGKRGAGERGAHGKPAPGARPGQPPAAGKHKRRGGAEMDLGKAYALRAQQEKAERMAAERARQEEARKRREARAKLAELLRERVLNVKDAEIARHFEYGGKIKRVYVTAEQLQQLNRGELGIVQLEGRYVVVDAATLAEAEQVFAPAIALKVDPNAPAEDDPYADPKYQVPDDLIW